jgi:hypothetical protein
MTDQPITPPTELMQQWMTEFYGTPVVPGEACTDLATRAAQWGADAELEACCEWLQDPDLNVDTYKLCAARRPKPQSLKEMALETLKYPKVFWSEAEVDTIRRALEQLDD